MMILGDNEIIKSMNLLGKELILKDVMNNLNPQNELGVLLVLVWLYI